MISLSRRTRARTRFRLVFAAGWLALAGFVQATTPPPPLVEETITSPDGNARVTIVPGPLSGAMPPPPGDETPPGHATARVERKGPDGRWRLAWAGGLANPVAPGFAILADGARYLVTTGNYFSRCDSPSEVAIYDGAGRRVRVFALDDLLSADYVRAIRHGCFSRDPEFTADGRAVRVAYPWPERSHESEPVHVTIRLADGVVLPQADRHWGDALLTVEKMEARRAANWAARRRQRAAPLRVPAGANSDDWNRFVRELQARRNGEGRHRIAVMLVPAGAAAPDDDRIDNAFAQLAEPGLQIDHVVFVSPDPQRLADRLAARLAGVPAGSMLHVTLGLVGTSAQAARVRRAAAVTGATVEWIDIAGEVPGITIPVAVPDDFLYYDEPPR
jgi:hypothetical protein